MRVRWVGFLRPVLVAALALPAACGRSTPDMRDRLSTRYVLQWSAGERALRLPDARSSELLLRGDYTFTQDCIDATGTRTRLDGTWQLKGGWMVFDALLDCVGAFPLERIADGRLKPARLHFALEPPLIVVMSELHVLYVAARTGIP
jgi:hypothetical protein